MSLAAKMTADRPYRLEMDRPGTLRDAQEVPQDIVVDNLSTTGCLLRTDADLRIGSLVTIGIAGIGVHPARISRVEGTSYGCAFIMPIRDADVQMALAGETLIEIDFPKMPSPPAPIGLAGDVSLSDGSIPHYSLRRRTAIIVGSAAIMWVATIAGTILFLR